MNDRTTPSEPCEILPMCPICPNGEMVKTTSVRGMHVCVCTACGSALSVPDEAMHLLRDRQVGGVGR